MTHTPAERPQPPFEAYKGDKPYVFVSYSHKDGAEVYREIERLRRDGLRIWYDEGIDPGGEWPEKVAEALARSAFFLVFVTPSAVASRNVKNEIHFALNEEKPFLAIHLSETELPPGLRLRMGDIQAIHKHAMTEERYARLLEEAIPAELRGRLTNKKVFACYASEDRDEVLRRIQVLDLLGIDVFLDVADVRPGESWDEALRTAIEQTEFMLLFWSPAARASKWVKAEWRYALKTRGLDYIRPLPLCLPAEAPPPLELAELHFGSRWLYLMNANRRSLSGGDPAAPAPTDEPSP